MKNKGDLSQKCYDLLNKIPQGKVTTYKEIAHKLGVKSYRAIGRIVGANPNAPQTPCHRVVKADGDISGYAFGVDKKIKLLEAEGVYLDANNKIKDFDKIIHKF
ncbi:MAG: MGMT family protein [Proteobacteria bacterium]|nr:MGMT family protein [Pseudomonadota bacterium]